MAGRGPAPKDPQIRQRRNKKSTRDEVAVGSVQSSGPPAAAPAGADEVGFIHHKPRLPFRPCEGCFYGRPRKKKGKGKKGTAAAQEAAKPACTRCNGTGAEPWHPLTISWWSALWDPEKNPWCLRYLPIHIPELERLAQLVDYYNRTNSLDALKEIRLQREAFGLTPRAQMSLQWTIKKPPPKPSSVPESTSKPPSSSPRIDPRKILFMDPAAGGGERA